MYVSEKRAELGESALASSMVKGPPSTWRDHEGDMRM
jgi:hypothetical protein